MREGIKGKCETCRRRPDCIEYLNILIDDNRKQLTSSKVKIVSLVIDCPDYEKETE